MKLPAFKDFTAYEKLVVVFSALQGGESILLLGGTVLANFTDILSEPVKEVVKQSPYALMGLTAVNAMLCVGLFKHQAAREEVKEEEKRVEEETGGKSNITFSSIDENEKELDDLIIEINTDKESEEMEEFKPIINRNPLLKMKDSDSKIEIEEEEPLLRAPGK